MKEDQGERTGHLVPRVTAVGTAHEPREFPLPEDEPARLTALRALRIADLFPDPAFDQITGMAARVFDVPMAVVSLIDDEHQWFKSAHGLGITHGPRAISFCAHTILGEEPLVVEDLQADPRFNSSPYVTGDGLRFYSGVPIHDRSGYRVGTFAILDRRPRDLTIDQVELLKEFGAWAESELKRGGEAYGRLFESVPVALFVEDFSAVVPWIRDLQSRVGDLRSHLADRPDLVNEALRLIRMTDANTRAVELLEAEDEAELLDVENWGPLSDGAREVLIDRLMAVAEGSNSVTGDYTWVSHKGREIPCHLQWTLPQQGGEPDYSRGLLTAVDMTHVSQVERALVESEHQYRDLFDNLPRALLVSDPEGAILDANWAAASLFGTSLEELIGTDTTEYYENPGDRQGLLSSFETTDVVLRPVVAAHQADGSKLMIRSISRAVRGPGGEIRYIESALEDITERLATENRVAMLAAILEHTSDLVTISNWDGTGLLYANPATQRAFKIPKDADLSQVPVLSFYDLDTRDRFRAEIIPALLKNGIWEGELEVRGVKEHNIPTSQVIVAHRDDTGRIIHVSTVARDLSEQKQAQAELEENRDRLAEAVRSKDRFLASISHEIRTPLAVVVGLAYELSERFGEFSPDEAAELSGRIFAQGTELTHIVEDLLVAARADTGALTTHPAATELRSLTSGLLSDLGPVLGASQIELVGSTTPAWADPNRVRQVVRNLVTNALRYGTEPIRIHLGPGGERALVSVRDGGDVIPEHLTETIFEPYGRAHDVRGMPGSVGLGLTVSRTLARLMGGDLTYRREGDENVFELSLPTGPPEE